MSEVVERIVKAASEGYGDDGIVEMYFDDPNANHGDLLAAYVAAEARNVAEDAGSEEEALKEAIYWLRRGLRNLQGAVNRLEELQITGR